MNSLGRGENKNDKKKVSVLSRETVGMTLLLFGAILFFIAVTGPYVFGDPGVAINSFFLGLLGMLFYPVDLLVVYLGFYMVFGKKLIPTKLLVRSGLVVLTVFFIVHLATAEKFYGSGYGAYLSGCWSAAGSSASEATGAGFIFGLIIYPVRFILSLPGAYVVFSLLLAGALFLLILATPLRKLVPGFKKKEREVEEVEEEQPVTFDELTEPSYRTTPETLAEPVMAERPSAPYSPRGSAKDESREILFGSDPASNYRNNLIFDRDSQINATRRAGYSEYGRTGIPTEPRRETENYRRNAESVREDYTEGYSERYTAQEESSRPAMARKITPAERTYAPREDFNYPAAPTYRAPGPSEPVKDGNDGVRPTYNAGPESYGETRSPYLSGASESRPAYNANETRPGYSGNTNETRPGYSAGYNAEASEARSAYPARTEGEERFRFKAAESEKSSERRTDSTRDIFRAAFSRPAEPKEEKPAPADEETVKDEERVARAFEELDLARRREEGKSRLEESSSLNSFREEPAEEAAEEETDDWKDFRRPEGSPRSRFGEDEPVRRSSAGLFDGEDEEEEFEDFRAETPLPPTRSTPRSFEGLQGMRRESAPVTPMQAAPAPVPKKHVYKTYIRPSQELFAHYNDAVTVSPAEIEQNSSIIIETLAGFHIDAEIVKVICGSAVTRYDINVPGNVAVKNVTKRDEEIAMRLHVRDGVNIYSNSEVGAISIEVPNSVRATVGLRSVMQSDDYAYGKPASLMFAIGKDVEGRNVCGNIVKMKHILVAGSTGSGKSVCLNAMLISLICKYSPEDLRLILIDPKKVEFAIFEGLPHLMINEVISDAQKAVTALNWCIKEMERRYDLFEKKTRSGTNVHNVDEYNANLTEDEEKLPKIVIVVDELADLMSVAKKDIEDRIQRIAQKARAAGMHLVIATQRPSVDVITGVIKGNLPTRIAFRVIQEVDSRTILDESGAEKLLGNGDMLYRTEGMFNCLRVQGAFIGSKEVQDIISSIKQNNEAYFDESVADYINKTEESGAGEGSDEGGGEASPLYIKALGIVVKLGSASISLIQRKCSVGYNHAGKIIEWMELMHYISPFEGNSKPRSVLLTKEEYETKYGKLD